MITDFALGVLVASVVALGLVVAIMLAALVWLARWAHRYRHVQLSQDETGAVTGQLSVRGEISR